MINYRVADLAAMLKQLRDAGVPVDEKTEESEQGKFGWATDPDGNRFELWEASTPRPPPAPEPSPSRRPPRRRQAG
jgi:predicted enzyme related to lactoylglutathione lyase